MSVLFLKDFFSKLRSSNLPAYKKLHSEIRSVAPLSAAIMTRFSHLSSVQIYQLRTIFLEYGIPEGVISSQEEIEEAYRIFYADYVHSAPK